MQFSQVSKGIDIDRKATFVLSPDGSTVVLLTLGS
jgi:hypothetical protein